MRLIRICLLLAVALLSSYSVSRASVHRGMAAGRLIQAKSMPQELSVEQIAALIRPRVVSLHIKDSAGAVIATGSGVVVESNRILTNYHVIEGASEITVNYADGRSVNCFGIVLANKKVDLAMISADTGSLTPVDVNFEQPDVGQSIVAVGNPSQLDGTVSTGIVSGLRSDGDKDLIQITAPISHGSSGGALVNMQGQLIGITAGYLDDSQNLNFAINLVPALIYVNANAGLADLRSALGGSAAPASAAGPGAAGSDSIQAAFKMPVTDSPLKGYHSFKLEVTVDSDFSSVMTKSQAQESVEAEMKSHGIKITDDDQAAEAVLEVEVDGMQQKSDDGTVLGYSGYVAVRVIDQAILLHADGSTANAGVVVYNTAQEFYSSPDDPGTFIKDQTNKDVDDFCTDYYKQN